MLGFVKKIFHLPGTRLSATTVLYRTVEKLPRIKSVVVGIQWDDGSVDMDWSQMTVADLVWVGKRIEREINHALDEAPQPIPAAEPPEAA